VRYYHFEMSENDQIPLDENSENGEDALHLLDTDASIELLFSDVVLPRGMNGVELAKKRHG